MHYLADAVVVIHAAYVAFVVLGLLAIVVGAFLQWKCTRNLWFRLIHLSMISIVVFEALVGMVCPLTTLERYLRAQSGQEIQEGTFVGRVVHDMLFFDAPQWIFTIAYCLFGCLVLATFIIAPPQWNSRSESLRTRVP